MPFVSVTVRTLVWPGNVSVLGAVALATVIPVGALKFNVPVTGVWFAAPPSARMFPAGIVFTQFAEPVATTSKSTSQVPLPAISAPVIVIEESPLLPVNDVAPAQVVCAFTGLARIMPAGRGSVRLRPVIGIAPELLSRTVTVDCPPEEMLVGRKLFVADREEVKVMLRVFELTGPTGSVVPSP